VYLFNSIKRKKKERKSGTKIKKKYFIGFIGLKRRRRRRSNKLMNLSAKKNSFVEVVFQIKSE
jgi:hypothetical protein